MRCLVCDFVIDCVEDGYYCENCKPVAAAWSAGGVDENVGKYFSPAYKGGPFMGVGYNYSRVMPRDLFNESKLLKCLGKILILADTTECYSITYEWDGEPWRVGRADHGNEWECMNIQWQVNGKPCRIFVTQNITDTWGCYLETDEREYDVFEVNAKGEVNSFSEELLSLMKHGEMT